MEYNEIRNHKISVIKQVHVIKALLDTFFFVSGLKLPPSFTHITLSTLPFRQPYAAFGQTIGYQDKTATLPKAKQEAAANQVILSGNTIDCKSSYHYKQNSVAENQDRDQTSNTKCY